MKNMNEAYDEQLFKPQYPAELYTRRPNHTAILSPLYDSTFKAIFTQETEDSKLVLKGFISAVFEREISRVELKNNEPPTESKKQKKMSFDVSVEFDDGEIADIELQARNQNYDFGIRAEIQAARLLTNNAKKGKKWDSPKVYQISVLNFHYKKDDKQEMRWYTMRDEVGEILTQRLNVIFIDLVTIRKKFGSPVEELKPIEKWGLFFSFVDKKVKADYVKNLVRSEKGIMAANTIVKKMSKADSNWYVQNSRYIAECDYNTIKANAKKQGLEEGQQQKAIENALNFLKMNVLTEEQIAQGTGLPLETVKKLAKKV